MKSPGGKVVNVRAGETLQHALERASLRAYIFGSIITGACIIFLVYSARIAIQSGEAMSLCHAQGFSEWHVNWRGEQFCIRRTNDGETLLPLSQFKPACFR
jgi:hypothetical protein